MRTNLTACVANAIALACTLAGCTAPPGSSTDVDAAVAVDASRADASTARDAAEDAADAAPHNALDAGIVRTNHPSTRPAEAPIAPFADCAVTTAADAIAGGGHRTPCDSIPYPYEPPSAGEHYSQWARFTTYDAPVPWGFLVHAMEHGAVVLAYHCEEDTDCDRVRAEYAAIISDHGVDPLCRHEDSPSRFIVVPVPTLPVPIAAVTWGHVYTATCLDPPSLRAFVTAHYGMGPERLCLPGVDRSSAGWCP